MNKQSIGTVGTAKLSMKLILSITLLMLASACDFINKGSSKNIPSDNPGRNASLAEDIARGPGDNTYRMLSAQRETQSCTESLSCTQFPDGRIEYSYSDSGSGPYLETATEFETDAVGDVVSFRRYFYDASNPDRLDKVAVRGETGNFHTLHDYTYDDENDPSDFLADVDDAQDDNATNDGDGYNGNLEIARPKLRLEYVCKIDVADASTETCDRDSAFEVIRYIYYADGRLYRKEFDVQNNTEIDHQKIYYYRDGLLTRVDTDNFYNGIVDERYTYERDFFDNEEQATLRLFIDNGFFAAGTRGIDRTVSYRIDEQNKVLQECYFRGELLGNQGNNNEGEISGACTLGSTQGFQWEFEWVESPCWAGGLDDIDPEARAIDFLCKQGG